MSFSNMKFGVVMVLLMSLDLAATTGQSTISLTTQTDSFQQKASTIPSESADNRGLDISDLDERHKPCVDFYKYANGGWIAKHPIPPELSYVDRIDRVTDKNTEILLEILQDAARNTKAAQGSSEQQIGDFYSSGMNTSRIEREGFSPLVPEFSRIDKMHDARTLQSEIARLQSFGVNAPFAFGSEQDFKDSGRVIGIAAQGGLGLPERGYYTGSDAESERIRHEYVEHITRMFKLLGHDNAKSAAQAQVVMSIEAKLAQASMTREQRRDPDASYHNLDLTQLKQLTPNFSWVNYFKDLGHPEISAINIAQPDFFKEMDRQLSNRPLSDWKLYLRWHLLNVAAPYLSSDFVDEDFSFNGKTLSGSKEMRPRWRRVVSTSNTALGEILGQLYVRRVFRPETRTRVLEMVHNLVAALRTDLTSLNWMGDATRQQAINKLDAFAIKIGYPDKWRNYSDLKIDRGPYIHNVLRANRFVFSRQLNKIKKPVDRTEWDMSPQSVDAYYNPAKNEIAFPAGILQPPFFDPNADDAFNYGAIGAVIGHEMTHGFDDEGGKFDAHGNLRNWYSPQDLKSFEQRAECIIKQFDSYLIEDTLHLNGKLVVGESIADLGGLTIAYAAFMKSREGRAPLTNRDGFTPEQRFFFGWARLWSVNMRPEMMRLQLNVNPHPFGQFRVNGPLSNMPAFAKAFSCQEGAPMVRRASERCQIW